MPSHPIGKRLFDDLYLHLSAIESLQDSEQRRLIKEAVRAVSSARVTPNVLKLNTRTGRLSLLAYEDFDESPFPTLAASWLFERGLDSEPLFRSYAESLNPPILHRKELLVSPEYRGRERWLALTQTAEALGLFDDARTIGFRMNWENVTRAKGYRLVGDAFIPLANFVDEGQPDWVNSPPSGIVQRHLTDWFR